MYILRDRGGICYVSVRGAEILSHSASHMINWLITNMFQLVYSKQTLWQAQKETKNKIRVSAAVFTYLFLWLKDMSSLMTVALTKCVRVGLCLSIIITQNTEGNLYRWKKAAAITWVQKQMKANCSYDSSSWVFFILTVPSATFSHKPSRCSLVQTRNWNGHPVLSSCVRCIVSYESQSPA